MRLDQKINGVLKLNLLYIITIYIHSKLIIK
jgi:hypothetical protein